MSVRVGEPATQNGQTETWHVYYAERCECHRDELVLYYLPIVHRVAGKIRRRVPDQVEAGDLVSLGTLGLFKAVQVYDPYRGKPFEPVAAAHIRSVILDSIRSSDWAPRSVRRHQREMDIAARALAEGLRREPTPREIAEFLGVGPTDVGEWLRETRRSHVGSLDELTLSGASVQVPDPRVSGTFERRALLQFGQEALAQLPLRWRAIIAMVHYEGMGIEAVATALRLSVEEVEAEHSRATQALREHLAASLAA